MVRDMLSEEKAIIRRALSEDIGDGDVTSQCIVPPDAALNGQFIAKEAGVVAGLEVVRLTFSLGDEHVQLAPHVTDGDQVEAGQVIVTCTRLY